jgi:hypothetical protein
MPPRRHRPARRPRRTANWRQLRTGNKIILDSESILSGLEAEFARHEYIQLRQRFGKQKPTDILFKRERKRF